MHEGKAIEDLVKDLSYSGLGKVCVPFLDHLVQILFHVLKHKVEGVILTDHLLQLNYICVGQLL